MLLQKSGYLYHRALLDTHPSVMPSHDLSQSKERSSTSLSRYGLRWDYRLGLQLNQNYQKQS